MTPPCFALNEDDGGTLPGRRRTHYVIFPASDPDCHGKNLNAALRTIPLFQFLVDPGMTSLDRLSAGLHCCQHVGSLGASSGTVPVRFCNLMSQLRSWTRKLHLQTSKTKWYGAIFQM